MGGEGVHLCLVCGVTFFLYPRTSSESKQCGSISAVKHEGWRWGILGVVTSRSVDDGMQGEAKDAK